MKKRIAIVGAGMMARVRGNAFLQTGKAVICAVASTRLETAKALADKLGVEKYYADYRQIAREKPDAVILEVPHNVQYGIAVWALEAGFDLLIGGVLAVTSQEALVIEKLAARNKRIVEAGYEARYDAVWEKARDLVLGGQLGRPVMAQSLALWPGNPRSWYYDQKMSGGMPLTHMTYCFINPIRWILGPVKSVCAVSNKVAQTGRTFISEETCAATLHFDGPFASIVGGFVAPPALPRWWAKIVCTEGAVEVLPEEHMAHIFTMRKSRSLSAVKLRSPFVRQAEAFLRAVDSRRPCLNAPSEAKVDVRIAEAIVASSRTGRFVKLRD